MYQEKLIVLKYVESTSIASTLSLILPLTGGTLSVVLTGRTMSASNLSAKIYIAQHYNETVLIFQPF